MRSTPDDQGPSRARPRPRGGKVIQPEAPDGTLLHLCEQNATGYKDVFEIYQGFVHSVPFAARAAATMRIHETALEAAIAYAKCVATIRTVDGTVGKRSFHQASLSTDLTEELHDERGGVRFLAGKG